MNPYIKNTVHLNIQSIFKNYSRDILHSFFHNKLLTSKEYLLLTMYLIWTSHISSSEWPYLTSGYHIGPSRTKVLERVRLIPASLPAPRSFWRPRLSYPVRWSVQEDICTSEIPISSGPCPVPSKTMTSSWADKHSSLPVVSWVFSDTKISPILLHTP